MILKQEYVKDKIHLDDRSSDGPERVVFGSVMSDSGRLFYVFPIDHQGDLLENKVHVERMDGARVERDIPEDVRSFLKHWIRERKRKQIVRELQDDLDTVEYPHMPDVSKEEQKLKEKYRKGEIGIHELERRLDRSLRDG